jgi:hypothetical protein
MQGPGLLQVFCQQDHATDANRQTMARLNQKISLNGWPNRFSFHVETNDRTERITGRSVIIKRLKAVNVSSGCTCTVESQFILRVAWTQFSPSH